jgi:hypothetical protein
MNDPRAIVAPQDLTIEEVGEKHEALITALADLIWPVIRERIKSTIDARIDDQLENKKDQGIANYLKYSYDLDQQISEYMSNHFDIRDYDVNDVVEDYMNDRLDDLVYDTVSNMTFEVRVSR